MEKTEKQLTNDSRKRKGADGEMAARKAPKPLLAPQANINIEDMASPYAEKYANQKP